MKALMLFAFFLISNVFAAERLNWSDLETEQNYTLRQKLELEASKLILNKGATFGLISAEGLPMINVTLFRFTWNECKNPEQESGLTIILPQKINERDRSVGVKLAKGCLVEIYVENHDFYSQSFF